MTKIVRASIQHIDELLTLAPKSFIDSHGHSASASDIDYYIERNFNETIFRNELLDKQIAYFLIYDDEQLAGYSKLTLNATNSCVTAQSATKLDRLYLLKAFYGRDLGKELMLFNLNFSKQNHQQGMWLFVWKENPRAIAFYQKNGFKIVGEGDFKISESHSNPNHIMYLDYQV
ncbi:MAG: GNAT family N-acetyltransferase [Pseudozobellia sp.]|nr:GNAT family N-acetyltransferase [Pseudozobellia sp.]MBG48642.1 GNAT family N-acetyltransferase [Pseudozobellia sp.]|tara:strand:+ start:452 stop:973 length:522 start_codon:yes stop_codon:yes gene_type:complete